MVGLSCRSLVPLMYTLAQLLLILLWLLDWRVITLRMVASGTLLKGKHSTSTPLNIAWYFWLIVAIVASTFAAIGGTGREIILQDLALADSVTVFQVMGLFKNCLCFLPVCLSKQFWLCLTDRLRSNIGRIEIALTYLSPWARTHESKSTMLKHIGSLLVLHQWFFCSSALHSVGGTSEH